MRLAVPWTMFDSAGPAIRQGPKIDDALVRGMDLIVAAAALLFLMPLLILIGVATCVSSPGPIFFRQVRIGVGGKRFYCYKFRSMVTDAQERLAALLQVSAEARSEWERDHKLKDDPRINGIGRFLRKSSMDELPQLINVLRGEMSLVGPRPIVDAEIAKYRRYFSDYCKVKPGITGLWQISGRNNVSYRRRVALDVAYSRSRCFPLDLRILVFTIPSVMLANGSY